MKKIILKFIVALCAVVTLLTSFSIESSIYSISKISPPENISVTSTSKGIKIKWSKSKLATGYYVYRKKSDSYKFTRIANVNSGNKNYYLDKNAKSCNYYIYAIKSYNAANTSSYKKSAKKYYIQSPKISKLKNNYASISVRWNKIRGASGYRLYRKTNDGSWKKIKTLKGDDKVTYTDKAVKNGRKYSYAIRAFKGNRISVRGVAESLKFRKHLLEITLNKEKFSLSYGKKTTITATPSIQKVTVKWKSSNPLVAKVNSRGKVTAVSVGTARITAYFTYKGKKYSKSAKVIVKEKIYKIGDTVDFEGKVSFKIESVRAHSLCKNSISGNDKVIITYSYKNINCNKKIKISNDNFVISDINGEVATYVEDCLHCISPQYCTEGVRQKSAVSVAALSSKGKYCYLRVILNIGESEDVTAKFKLNIDRNYSDFLNDENIFSTIGSSVNTLMCNVKNKDEFKILNVVCCFDKTGNIICGVEYQYISLYGELVSDCVKIWKSNNVCKVKDCQDYFFGNGFLHIQKQKHLPKYDFQININNVEKNYNNYPQLNPVV